MQVRFRVKEERKTRITVEKDGKKKPYLVSSAKREKKQGEGREVNAVGRIFPHLNEEGKKEKETKRLEAELKKNGLGIQSKKNNRRIIFYQ